jgi:membrane protein YdbS with pleckstrin-like domain
VRVFITTKIILVLAVAVVFSLTALYYSTFDPRSACILLVPVVVCMFYLINLIFIKQDPEVFRDG